MPQGRSSSGGGIKLFTLFGITVYLHWAWFVVAAYEIQRQSAYTSIAWNVAEYLALFCIVLMHEFGHALACRSVGGTAERILLWPLGGVAYVRPPMRPGAWLWSIVAGPLVNVALIPLTFGLSLTVAGRDGDVATFVRHLWLINILLLCFNLLPIYPLDGGKILWSLLWFVFGQARSLMIASILGIVSTAAGVILILARSDGQPDIWLIAIAGYAILQSINGLKSARAMLRVNALPKNESYACPSCRQSPPRGLVWTSACGTQSDPFEVDGRCPTCGEELNQIRCPLCGVPNRFHDWRGEPAFPITPSTTPPPIPNLPG